MSRTLPLITLWGVLGAAAGCGADSYSLSLDELMDPEACASCHPEAYREWAGSMHAYAVDDPVFTAMLARGEREQNATLSVMCLQCHAPMALKQGLVSSGADAASVPQRFKGVTCYFCHAMTSADGPTLSTDGVMLGQFADPIENDAHASAYSPVTDRNASESSRGCGACHANTFGEWRDSVFGNAESPLTTLSCGRCHMPGREGVAATGEGMPVRRIHDHRMPGIDVALTPWPDTDGQLAAIHADLDPSLLAKLCVVPAGEGLSVEVTLDNLGSGHNWPSGVARNRRAWVELVAYAGTDVAFASGRIADDQIETGADPALWELREWMHDADGLELFMPWESGTLTTSVLTPAVTADPSDPRYYHAQSKTYAVADTAVDRVTLRVRIRPMGLDLLDELIESGDLAPAVRDAMPTLTPAGTELEWTKTGGFGCVP